MTSRLADQSDVADKLYGLNQAIMLFGGENQLPAPNQDAEE